MIFLGLSELFGGPENELEPRPTSNSDADGGSSGDSDPVGTGEVQEIVQTPSGIEILYQTQPKRLYKLRFTKRGEETSSWTEVPSVTNVLKVLDKPALSWWGMKTGVEGMIALHRDHDISLDCDYSVPNAPYVEQIVSLLTEHKLTVNHVRDKAGDRGHSVHTAFQVWADTFEERGNEVYPNPELYPENERGYIQALCNFITDAKLTPLQSEVMVGSLQYGYAGRYDLQAFYGGHEVVTHLTPKKEKRGELCEPGLGLFDLKTSSGIYPETHYRQLEAYETASVECGYDPTDFRAVVQVCADGRYQVKLSTAVFDDFKHVLDVYRDNQRLKGKT